MISALMRSELETINIIQGEFRISSSPSVKMTTVLGSCIAACIYDSESKIGGMNHFLLPEPAPGQRSNVKFGAYLMELLLNEMLKSGAKRSHLRAKLYGGSKMNATMGNVGDRNIEFVNGYLESEGIPIVATDLGGTQARRIGFHPSSGSVDLKVANVTVNEERVNLASAQRKPPDVLLF